MQTPDEDMNQPREHMLISRIVDGDVSDAVWRELEALGHADPLLWKRLAEAHRDQAALSQVVRTAASVADSVPLPNARSAADQSGLRSLTINRFGAWTGWAVAALLALVALPQLHQQRQHAGDAPAQQAQLANLQSLSAADAFQHYLDRGREAGLVVGEVPSKLLVETRPMPSGEGYELLYLRQVLERTVVPDLYEFQGQDESGRPTLVRYGQPASGRF